jgi:glutamine synthetase adenylyltransferase
MAAEPAASGPLSAPPPPELVSGDSPDRLLALLAEDAAIERWATAVGLADPDTARRVFRSLKERGLSTDLLSMLIDTLGRLLPGIVDADRVLVTLERFLGTLHSPLSAVALFQRDPSALQTLLAIVATSPYLARGLRPRPGRRQPRIELR